jgi:CubicO group peptidase (beta-lactamase class C family)
VDIQGFVARCGAFIAALAASVGLAGAALAQDATGDWHGVLALTPAVSLPLAIHLKAGPHGLQGTLDNPDQGVFDEPLADVSATGGKLVFTGTRNHGVFNGAWDAAAHGWQGALTVQGRDYPIVFTAGDLPRAPAVAGLDGEWDGMLNMGVGLYLRLAFHIQTGPHGTTATMDSVDQGAYGSPVTSISRDGDHVVIVMKAISAGIDAQYSDQGPSLAGGFTQNGQQLAITLKRLPPGQPSPWPKPATSGSATALPANWQTPSDADIRALLVERIDAERQGVGIVVGVVDASGRRVVAFGRTDADSGRPLNGDTEFEIGSISKVFTALTLAEMVQKGEVRLDDPIAKYLPPGATAPSRDGEPITLVDLATHTSGLPRIPTNFAPKDMANPYADYSMDQLWAFLSSYQLPRDPGATWEYSNLGFGLLGDLIARRAGTDYERLVKARVTGPLGMPGTTISLTPDQRARLAVGHDSSLRMVANWDLPALAGAGGLRSTANDLMTFLAAELGLTPSPLEKAMALTLQVRRPTGAGPLEQALGWEVLHLPTGDIVQHGGGTGGYHTFVAFSPKRRVGVVILTNAETPAGADDIGLHILVGWPVIHLPPPPPPPELHAAHLDAKQLDALTGTYQLGPQATVTITREGEHLYAQLTGQGRFEVFPSSLTEVFWKVVDAQATFTLGPDGRATALTLSQNGRDLPAPRVP